MYAKTSYRRGQAAIIMILAIPALIAAVAFGTDITVLYMNWTQLQKSTDSAVTAGAAYLPSEPAAAISMARRCARLRGIRNDEIATTQVGADGTTISMTVTRKVSLLTRFLGVGQGKVAAHSTAVVRLGQSGSDLKVRGLSA
jgi:Flp pilus assembly protein TadG